MRVGILTFHRAYNYGAVLQAYALQKKLNDMGVNSEIIDYLSLDMQSQMRLFSYDRSLSIKGNFIKFVKDFYRKKKNMAFDLFIGEEMQLSQKRYSDFNGLVKLDRQNLYDVYIVGSDQVWNNKNNLEDRAFLLGFTEDDTKKCSYAASLGNAHLDGKVCEQYQKELKKFRVLTVREEDSIEKYKFLSENGAKAVIDPTLLLKKEKYETIASPRIVKRKYAFLYTIAQDRKLRKYARKFCKENGLILVDSKRSRVFFKNSSPRDFLSFIKHSEYVFTNSFHGTAFSIIMQKQFATELNTKHSFNNRSNDLMMKTGLLYRDIESDSFDMKEIIDYKKVNGAVKELRDEAVQILREIVREQ